MRTRLAVLSAFCLIIAAAPAPADAASRWPTKVVTYRAAAYPEVVREVVRHYNSLPTDLLLVRAKGGSPAMITIRKRRLARGIGGAALLPPGGEVVISTRLPASLRFETIAHELGHAVGLEHSSLDCSLMRPVLELNQKRACSNGVGDGLERCGVQRPDLRQLVARYGGRVGTFSGTLCDSATGELTSEQPSP